MITTVKPITSLPARDVARITHFDDRFVLEAMRSVITAVHVVGHFGATVRVQASVRHDRRALMAVQALTWRRQRESLFF